MADGAGRGAGGEAHPVRGAGTAREEELARQLGKDSSNSSKPPSSDGPYRKPRDRSLRRKSGRRPGKQPGAPSSTLAQSPDPDPDAVIELPPQTCGGCGHDLSGEPVLAEQKRQVFEVAPPPPPMVTEYRVQSKACPCCGTVSAGLAPAGVTGRVQYGPLVHARKDTIDAGKVLPGYTGVIVRDGYGVPIAQISPLERAWAHADTV